MKSVASVLKTFLLSFVALSLLLFVIIKTYWVMNSAPNDDLGLGMIAAVCNVTIVPILSLMIALAKLFFDRRRSHG